MIAILSGFTKLPVIAPLFNFLRNKSRLACEYGLIAVVIVIGTFTVTQWYGKMKLETRLAYAELSLGKVEGRLQIVEAVNEAHEQTIESLRELRERDALALERLLSDYHILSMQDATIRNELHALRNSNQTVLDYLDQPVPSDLARLLHQYETGTGNPDRHESGGR